MRTAEVLLQDFDTEMDGVRKTLERIPESDHEYKLHDKSMAMGKLAMHVATMPIFGKYILTAPEMNLSDRKLPQPDLTFRGREPMLKMFDEAVSELRTILAEATDEELAFRWKFSFGDVVISNDPRSQSYRRMFFNHTIHHRAQLGVYLRLKDVPVPGLYGPSADEPFVPKG